MPTSIVF